MAASTAQLKIGDYVTFRSCVWETFFLSAEGILCEYPVLSDDLLNFNDMTFCVHLQRQYSAAKELKEFLSLHSVKEAKNIKDPVLLRYYKTLLRGFQNEIALNDNYMKINAGKPVLFGDIIQLYHVQSKKYLKVYPDKLAKVERENLRVDLHSNGDMYSWIQLLPRYKIDKIGDSVINLRDLYLKIAERLNEYVHCSDLAPSAGRQREVNCSLESSAWKLNIFQTMDEAMDPDILMASEIISIHDPETKCNLIIRQKSKTDDGNDNNNDNKKMKKDNNKNHSNDNNTNSNNSENNSNSIDDSNACPEFIHEHGNLLLEPMESDDTPSGALWVIESKKIIVGGAIRWKTEKVRLKHLNTSQYLCTVQKVINSELVTCVSYTSIPNDTTTLFDLRELHNSSNFLSNAKATQIHQNLLFFERLPDTIDLSFAVKLNKSNTAAVSLLLIKYTGPISEKGSIDTTESLDEVVGVMLRKYMCTYLEKIVVPKNDQISTLIPSADKSDLEFYSMLLDRALYFSQGFPISSIYVNLDIEKGRQSLRYRRQVLFREQFILEALLGIVEKLIVITEWTEAKNSSSKIVISDSRLLLIEQGNKILSKCLLIIYHSLCDNPMNQLYIADYMHVLSNHLGGQPLAGKCVTEMLSTNMELQETKIGNREISMFVDKLRSAQMNSMYLCLIQACCSCMGDGVDGNQCKIVKMIFDDPNDVVIQVHADISKTVSAKWNVGGLYIPSTTDPTQPVRGYSLVENGLPLLSIAWTTKSIDFSPLGLFGRLSVGLDELYGSNKASMKMKSSKAKVSTEQRLSVATYFVNQLFLCAELCLDRNYVAMHTIDEMFPYEYLITILKLGLSENIKAAAVRLLMCLHVDRDPQAEIKIPILTRAWTDIQKREVPSLPYVEPLRQNMFGLVQDIVADHVNTMIGTRWYPLSTHMLKVLHCMLRFNFYGTNERLLNIIDPVIKVMDRRKVKSIGLSATGSFSESRQSGDAGDAVEVMEAAKPTKPWQERVLTFMESLPTMLAVLALVLAAVAITIYTTISGAVDGPGTGLYIWGIVVLIIFIMEVGIRAYCHTWVRGSFYTFVTSFFNIIDVVVISIDIVFLCLPTDESGGSGKFTKILRLVRMIRLLRVLRAARVVSAFTTKKDVISIDWKMPSRYSKVPGHELHSMVEACEILLFARNIIEDRNLSLLLRGFYLWESGNDKRNPTEIFNQVLVDARDLMLQNDEFDLIFLDTIMFVHAPLVQCSLDVLMARYTMRESLMNNISNVQLLVSPRRERQFRQVEQMLQQLERNAETHELWGELEKEAHHATNKQTIGIIKELTDMCRIRPSMLSFECEYLPDVGVQNLFRNLGCFTICFKVLGLLDSVQAEDDDGVLDEVSANTRNLCLLCNQLLYWFFYGNAENQALGYEQLPFFVESLDSQIESHLMFDAIFRGNEKLITAVPYSYLSQMAETICKDGKSPHCLYLFLSITNIDDKNIVDNQYEIMKQLTSTGRLEKVGLFFCPVGHPDYVLKRELMNEFTSAHADKKNVVYSDLSPLLAYHLLLVDVLSACTIGRLNITTIEAKVQTVYALPDVIASILDTDTILFAKIKMARFLLNAQIDVEMMIPGLENLPCIWQLLASFVPSIRAAPWELIQLNSIGIIDDMSTNKLVIEYMIVAVGITSGFFTRYYDPSTYRFFDVRNAAQSPELVVTSQHAINELIHQLFEAISTVYTMNSRFLSVAHKTTLREALEALSKCSLSATTIPKLESTSHTDDTNADGMIDVEEEIVQQKFNEFVTYLKSDDVLKVIVEDEGKTFVHSLEQLPFISDNIDSDLRYEGLITKLVSHISENIVIINSEKRMNSRCVKTTIWIIKALRKMIENRMGMSIYERDENGGEEQDIAVAPVIKALNGCGVIGLLLDLIAVGINDELQAEAIKLCVGMLYKEGGALEVQTLINTYLKSIKSDLFFKQISMSIQKLIAAHRWNGVVILESDKEPELLPEFIIIRFLQLMCEGHYLGNQDIMREQPFNAKSYNLLDDFVTYINCLTRIPCRTSTKAALAVTATILEVIQGPCVGNQTHFTLNTELLETLNRLLRAKVINDCDAADELELKKTGIDILQGLLEGQGQHSVIYDRALSVIHLDLILNMSGMKSTNQVEGAPPYDYGGGAALDDKITEVKSECIVLLQVFCDFRQSLREELGLSTDIADIVSSGTASVEIVWHGVLQRRFFYISEICYELSKSSKDMLVENVDRSTSENKLIDFIDRSHVLYREVKHQHYLKEIGVSSVFSVKNLDNATAFSFMLAIAANAILIAFWRYDISRGLYLPTHMAMALQALNIALLIVSIGVLITSIVVRTPVFYQTLKEGSDGSNTSTWILVVKALFEPLTVYYCLYIVICSLSLTLSSHYLPLLLLDIIVKNSTTRDVLRAVIVPYQQLMWTLILMLFVIYIFAFFMFSFYPQQFNDDDPQANSEFCRTLWNCLLVNIGYGLRSGGGIADYFRHDMGVRLYFDMAFFLIVMIVMLNVVFGIIIDTFSSLRAEKNDRTADTLNKCFICAIDKQIFNRNSDVPNGYIRHIKYEHHMWNYLYYIFFLWEQDKDDDDGLEQYVRRAVDNVDITWFPLNKAICLDIAETPEQLLHKELNTKITATEGIVNGKVGHFSKDISLVFKTLSANVIQSTNDIDKLMDDSVATTLTAGATAATI